MSSNPTTTDARQAGPNPPAKFTHYKFTTADGRRFFVLNEDTARRSAAKCGGTYHGPADRAEVLEVVRQALRPDLRAGFASRNLRA